MPRTGYLFVVAVALIGAFAFSGPAGADHVAGQEPYFSCQASTARVTLLNGDPIPPVDPLGANLEREECAEDTGGLPDLQIPPPPADNPLLETTTAQARTQILCATDDPDPLVTPENNEDCDSGRRSYEQQVLSTADVTDTTVRLGPLTIIVQAANTLARASCGPGNLPVLNSDSKVLGLSIAGSPVPVPDFLISGNPNQVIEIPNLLKITLNELLGTPGAFSGNAEDATFPDNAPSGFVTRRAVHLEVLPGLAPLVPGNAVDVVVSESTADFHGDVCPEGKVVIKKETAPDEDPNSSIFNFGAPGLQQGTFFNLTDDGVKTFDEVTPQEAAYTVTEGAQSNSDYHLTAIQCVENRTENSDGSVVTRTASVKVEPGETVTCTFINAKPPPGVCPAGSTPNQQGQCIIDTISCPPGSTLNNQGQCIVNTTTCPEGSTRPDPNGPCVVTNITCPPGSTGPNQQGQCISNTITCPAGSTNQQGQCVNNTVTCPPGSTLQNGQCVNNTITCPAGTQGPNAQGQCVNNTLNCPAGSTQVGNQCVVSRPDCPQGSTRNAQGQCVITSVQCPAGTSFNPTTLGCTSAPLGGTLVPINQVAGAFAASPCIGQAFGALVGIVGTNGDDRITGTNTSDRIFALGGNDRVSGGRGDDCVEGGSGRDVIDGSNGNDVMLGATGNDSASGGPGRDRITGGSGSDGLRGDAGNDSITGGSGRDKIRGGDGNDRLVGGSGNDGIHTGNGRDRVNAGSGNDIINAATRGAPAFVDCGPGKDRVRVNKNERHRTRNCEFIDITRRIKGAGTPR